MTQNTKFDIAVVGTGLVGLASALALSQSGKSVILIGPQPKEADGRTTAILLETVKFFKEINIWDELSSNAIPLRTMRIIDALDRLIKAPQVDFNAAEISAEAFGYNIKNTTLSNVLKTHIKNTIIETISTTVRAVEHFETHIAIACADGTKVDCELLVGADGGNSTVRASANIETKTTSYPQVAVVSNLSHTLPHGDVSTEFHMPTGPFTLVPLEGNNSSLVWVESPEEAKRLTSLSLAGFGLHAERKMQSFLGKISVQTSPQSFPLSSKLADRLGIGRTTLLGEAGHVFPPIGAQGFNLGIRDIIGLVELVKTTPKNQWSGLGDSFHSKRSTDVAMRTAAVDALNRSLLSSMLPMQLGRSLGLYLLGNIGPLRRMAMREGMLPGSQSKHMRTRLSSMAQK